MLSPCGGCDPHLAAAVVCYLSFFVSACSFFLYWYWLSTYREELNPHATRYSDSDSDCQSLDVDNPEVGEQDPEEFYPPYHLRDEDEDELCKRSQSHQPPLPILCHLSHQIQPPHEQAAHSQGDLNSPSTALILYEQAQTSSQSNNHPHDDHTHLPSSNKSKATNINDISTCGVIAGSTTTEITGIINNVTRNGEEEVRDGCNGGVAAEGGDNASGMIGLRDSITNAPPDVPTVDGGCNCHCDCDRMPDEEDNRTKCQISDNPYLNGNNLSQNMMWGLLGIITNLIETIIAAIFYYGLFEDNLTTSLIWLIGFGTTFILGNILHFILLIYFTNKVKMKQLWLRWTLETIFHTVKDVYYFWVGAALFHHIVKV